MTLGTSIRRWMVRAGIGDNESELSRRSGVSQSTIHRILNGESRDPRHSNLERIARALGTTAADLRAGKVPSLTDDPGSGIKDDRRSTERAEGRAAGLAPVIEWTQSAMPQSADAKAWRDAPVNAGPDTFWLQVQNDSMLAPAGTFPTFPPGTFIAVDPSRSPRPGDFCLAQTPDGPTFKRLVADPPDRKLVPLNPGYSPLPLADDVQIIGTVIRSETDLV